MRAEAWERFHRFVLAHPAVLDRLMGIEDEAGFVEAAVAAASESGEAIGPEELRAAIRQARREWSRREL